MTPTTWAARGLHTRATVTGLVWHWGALLVEVTWHQHPHRPGATGVYHPGRLSLAAN